MVIHISTVLFFQKTNIYCYENAGDYSYPDDAFGTQDGNEATDPSFPQLRSMDGLNQNDPAIEIIRGGGVTTSLVLPGSANVMGGEATFVKLKGKTQRNMFIQNPPRAVKMACGVKILQNKILINLNNRRKIGKSKESIRK